MKTISNSAAKFIYKRLMNHPDLDPEQIAEEQDLWLADEWTHVGYCILTCLDNQKLVEGFKKNPKMLDSLIGKTMKAANMTVDAELIRELMPLIVKAYF
jgi:Asp-tRNA(Asn)/Glu-tRNA(Gln) amidotransferase B subunit